MLEICTSFTCFSSVSSHSMLESLADCHDWSVSARIFVKEVLVSWIASSRDTLQDFAGLFTEEKLLPVLALISLALQNSTGNLLTHYSKGILKEVYLLSSAGLLPHSSLCWLHLVLLCCVLYQCWFKKL